MSYSKQKGTKFETDIVKYLTECGFTTARRVPLSGASGDKGDIWLGEDPVNPYIIIECKNYAKELPYKMIEDFVEEAHTEYCNAKNIDIVNNYKALLISKRVNLGVTDSWLIWKNTYGITLRCRLGDVINKTILDNCKNENERIDKLIHILSDTSIAFAISSTQLP